MTGTAKDSRKQVAKDRQCKGGQAMQETPRLVVQRDMGKKRQKL